MGNYIIFGGFENPRRGGQARNLTTNVPKILDLKSSSEQIFSKNCRWVPLLYFSYILSLHDVIIAGCSATFWQLLVFRATFLHSRQLILDFQSSFQCLNWPCFPYFTMFYQTIYEFPVKKVSNPPSDPKKKIDYGVRRLTLD